MEKLRPEAGPEPRCTLAPALGQDTLPHPSFLAWNQPPPDLFRCGTCLSPTPTPAQCLPVSTSSWERGWGGGGLCAPTSHPEPLQVRGCSEAGPWG